METLQLQDIHLPASADFWPLALGWWILLATSLFITAWLVFKTRQQAKRRKYRKSIYAQFEILENKLKSNPSNATIAEINTLIRQLAINYYPRAQIASLTGGDWLTFLDKSGGTQDFSRGAGRILIEAPYQLDKHRLEKHVENLNINEFTPLIKRWMRKVVRSNS